MSVLYLHRKSLSQNSWHPKQGPNRSKDALGRSDDMVLAIGIKEDNRGWSMKGKNPEMSTWYGDCFLPISVVAWPLHES